MAEFPALPLWTDAYLADTSHLKDAERGRYDLILFHLWRAPMQRFPNEDTWLARKFGRSVDEIASEFRPLIREFCQCTGNWITQKRLAREWEYVSNVSKKQSVRAKNRWEKEKDISRGSTTSGIAPTPTPTPTPQSDEDKSSSLSVTRNFEGFWLECPKKVGKGAGRKAFLAALSKTDPETLVLAMRKYAASRVGEPDQYTAHPATWLHQERWTDEITEGAKNGNGRPKSAHDKLLSAGADLIREFESGAAEGQHPDDAIDQTRRALPSP